MALFELDVYIVHILILNLLDIEFILTIHKVCNSFRTLPANLVSKYSCSLKQTFALCRICMCLKSLYFIKVL